MNWESKEFRDLCEGQQCYLEVDGVCNHDSTTVVPCHSNESAHGKGMRIKAHDLFTVPGCSNCHFWLDHGPAPREVKKAAWRHAWERWMLHLFVSGVVVIPKLGRIR
jgi:hypothetical protein